MHHFSSLNKSAWKYSAGSVITSVSYAHSKQIFESQII